MAIVAFDNANFQSDGASTSAAVKTMLLTATAGACLLVAIHSNETGTMSAVAAGGNACGLLGYVVNGVSSSLQVWGLTSPGSGVLTLSARLAGTTQAIWCWAAATYTGQRTIGGSPFSTVISASAGGTAISFNISSSADDMVTAIYGLTGTQALTVGTGQTERGSASHGGGMMVWADITGTTGTMTLTATVASGNAKAVLGINIFASVSVAAANRIYFCMMMGAGR